MHPNFHKSSWNLLCKEHISRSSEKETTKTFLRSGLNCTVEHNNKQVKCQLTACMFLLSIPICVHSHAKWKNNSCLLLSLLIGQVKPPEPRNLVPTANELLDNPAKPDTSVADTLFKERQPVKGKVILLYPIVANLLYLFVTNTSFQSVHPFERSI